MGFREGKRVVAHNNLLVLPFASPTFCHLDDPHFPHIGSIIK